MTDGYDSEVEEDEGGTETVFGHAFDWGQAGEAGVAEPDVLRFELAGHSFAVEAMHVSEVDNPPIVTEVPGLPPHVSGITIRRRKVLGMLDLAAFLGISPISQSEPRLLVFDASGLQAGAVVDSVLGLEVWSDEENSQELEEIDDRIRPYLIASRWAPGGRVFLLNMNELLRAAAVR